VYGHIAMALVHREAAFLAREPSAQDIHSVRQLIHDRSHSLISMCDMSLAVQPAFQTTLPGELLTTSVQATWEIFLLTERPLKVKRNDGMTIVAGFVKPLPHCGRRTTSIPEQNYLMKQAARLDQSTKGPDKKTAAPIMSTTHAVEKAVENSSARRARANAA